MNAMLDDETLSSQVKAALYPDGGDGRLYESDINYYLTEAFGGHQKTPASVKRFGGGETKPAPGRN